LIEMIDRPTLVS